MSLLQTMVLGSCFVHIRILPFSMGSSQMALVIKNLCARAGGGRNSGSLLGWEDPPEDSMATHSSILAWRTPWTEKPGGLQFMGSQRVGHD